MVTANRYQRLAMLPTPDSRIRGFEEKKLTLAALLAHKCAIARGLLATPKDGAFIRREPHPALMPVVAILIPVAGFWHTKRLSSTHILEHPFTNHRLGNSINDAGALGRNVGGSNVVIAGACNCRVGGRLGTMHPILHTTTRSISRRGDVIEGKGWQAWALRRLHGLWEQRG